MRIDQPPMPENPAPIVSIGAGGIVRNAHYPAYALAGFPVFGVFDSKLSTAQDLARDFGIDTVFGSLTEAVEQAPEGCVFDIAVPAYAILPILEKLPDGAAVLIQKPFGETLDEASDLRQICREKALIAAVNFQLRYAPYVLVARQLIAQGLIGDLHDIDVKVNVNTPWQLWDFLEKAPRMEIVYHSIHYVDLIRALMGEPASVLAKTIKHPVSPKLDSSRSALIFDYGDWKRASILTYHGHAYGPQEQESYVKLEGTKGVIKFQMGLNMDYPKGRPDYLRYAVAGSEEWKEYPFEGSWFPHAFIGPMASVMRFMEGSESSMQTDIEDAYRTMAVVEAAYTSSARGGEPIPD